MLAIRVLLRTSFESMSLYRWLSFPLESSFFFFRLLVTQVQVRLVGRITTKQLHLVGDRFERVGQLCVARGCFENVISAAT